MCSALLAASFACAAPVDFTRDIQPIFAKRCVACHGAAQQMKDLRLDGRDSALKVIVPGNSTGSKLIARVSSDKKGFSMPPVGAPLTPAEIAVLRTWIDEGAKWPAAAKPTVAATLWSLKPVQRPQVPGVRQRTWARNPIDNFVLARLESENIQPSPEANRTTLLRRVSLDLTGLPPTPAEIAAFIADNRPDAYERVVDSLIASPHYGEKWARQWLDLAHYADSDGYEKDRGRPWAWRYRQWVIDALNRDMPFDEFTIDQLAGDLLPSPTVDQRIATGFLRNTLTNREAGVDRAEARFEQIVNRTNTVSTTWLGLTVGCAQCHNHKFDPISHKDYYSMLAFFENAEERTIDAPLPGEAGPYLQALPEYRHKREQIIAEYKIRELEERWEARLKEAFEHQGKDLEWDFAVTEFRAGYDGERDVLTGDRTRRSAREQGRLIDFFLGSVNPDFAKNKPVADSLKAAREKLIALAAALPQYSQAPVVEVDPTIPPTRMHLGGDYKNTGDLVEPNTLAILPALPAPHKDRLSLARWIVAPSQPLTARVAVNRMWQEFFGIGLVRTSEDFGTQGEAPSHPELLDWLASEFVERGWSMKQMHRLIVASATYRQSSHARKELDARDPENRLIARQTRLRLPAELVRDAALSASGLLNPEIGGRSVRPAQPAGVAELGYGNSVKWVESKGMDRYRRGLYIHYQRTTPYPLLSNFDAPESNVTCSRRRRSDTPLQSLNLLNDPVFFEAAQALAIRVWNEASGEVGDKLDYAFELCTGRGPSSRERDRLLRYLTAETAAFHSDEKSAAAMLPVEAGAPTPEQRAAWVAVSRVLLNLDEFITRE